MATGDPYASLLPSGSGAGAPAASSDPYVHLVPQNRAETAAESVLGGDIGLSPATASKVVGAAEDVGAGVSNIAMAAINGGDYLLQRAGGASKAQASGNPAFSYTQVGPAGEQLNQDILGAPMPGVQTTAPDGTPYPASQDTVGAALSRTGAGLKDFGQEAEQAPLGIGAVSRGVAAAAQDPDVQNTLNALPVLGAGHFLGAGEAAAEAAAEEAPAAVEGTLDMGPVTPEELQQKGVGGLGAAPAAAKAPAPGVAPGAPSGAAEKPRVRVVDGKLVPVGAAPAVAPPANPEPVFEPAADENARTEGRTPQERAQLAQEAHDLGVNETRESALSGDRLEAATDFDISKNKAASTGQRMTRTIEGERQALRGVPSQMLEANGGVADTTENTDEAAGKEMAAPVTEYRKALQAKVQQAYEDVKAQHGNTPLQPTAINTFLHESHPEFTVSTEGQNLQRGIGAWLQKNDLLDSQTGQVRPMNVYQAERLRQFVNDSYNPRTAKLGYGLKDAIDDDVTRAAGENVYKQARAIRSYIGAHFEEQPSIVKLDEGDDRLGIARKVPFEDVGKHIEGVSAAEFRHYLGLLEHARQTSPELAQSVSRALTQVRSHFLRRIIAEGDKTADMWNSKGVNAYLRANEGKLTQVLRPGEIQQLQKLNRVGNALRMDRTYRGAYASRVIGESFGVKALRKGSNIAGVAVGGHTGGIVGSMVGHGVGKIAEHFAETAADRAVEKRIVNLAEEVQKTPPPKPAATANGAPRRLSVPRSQRGGPRMADFGPREHTISSANGTTTAIPRGSDRLQVVDTQTKPEAQGRGEGVKRMRLMYHEAQRQGRTLVSDTQVSSDQAHVYDALERRGYTVERNPNVEQDADGTLRSTDMRPVYSVTGAPTEEDAAPRRPLQAASGAFARQRGGPKMSDFRRQAEAEKGGSAPPKPLEGMPTEVDVPGHGKVSFGPNPKARAVAASYMARSGLKYAPPANYAKLSAKDGQRVAQAYEAMKHDPTNPEVQKAYGALVRETKAQWDAIRKSGLKVEFIKPGQPDPYAASPRLAHLDVRDNNHLWVYPTDSGFGSQGADTGGHPLLQPAGVKIDGHAVTNNDLFRIVHDYFGHVKEGNGFRAQGEYNAYRIHKAMYSPAAQRALASETLGQNAWVNFGPHAEENAGATGAKTIYADQKAGLMPADVDPEHRGAAPAANLTFRHFSNAEGAPEHLTLDPKHYGSGLKGAELRRMQNNGGPKVISAYAADHPDEAVEPELRGKPEYRITVPSSKVYDLNADPKDLRQEAALLANEEGIDAHTAAEQILKGHGYAGYHTPAAEGVFKGQARFFEPVEAVRRDVAEKATGSPRAPLRQGYDPAAALLDAQVQRDVEAAHAAPAGAKRPPLRQGDDAAQAIYEEQARQDANAGTPAAPPEAPAPAQKAPASASRGPKAARFLTPEERAGMKEAAMRKLVTAFDDAPKTRELAAAALAGEAKRGWYKQAAHSILTVFGGDAPRFTALLAAMSPQTNVEMNFHNALRSFVAWDAAGRPTDAKSIVRIMEENSLKNPKSLSASNILDNWKNNAVRALTSKDPDTLQLSGPKVDSFNHNLRENVNAVTLDAWMASFAGMDPAKLGGTEIKAPHDELRGSLRMKNATYKAYSARVREAAELLTKMTGNQWTPAEVQETVWSWAKAATEHADSYGGLATIPELVKDGEIHDDLIKGTSDFHNLFEQPGHATVLGSSNFAGGLEKLRAEKGAAAVPRTSEEARAAAQSALRPHLEKAARRLEKVRTAGGADPVPF